MSESWFRDIYNSWSSLSSEMFENYHIVFCPSDSSFSFQITLETHANANIILTEIRQSR